MNCRHCGYSLDLPFLDLGTAPPSNSYVTTAELDAPEKWYPLKVLVCRNCWLVQTQDYAAREELFNRDYAYFSSYSSSWLAHAKAYVGQVSQRFRLGPSSLVAEVAANDGYLLQYVSDRQILCYGIEPTKSTAAAAKAKGLEVIEEFFGIALAQELARAGRCVDLAIANNVLAHVPDINDFVSGFAILLKPSGVATFEFPHLFEMVSGNQFDTAYHEHYSYLSLTAATHIFEENGLTIFDVEQLPTHGGSLRVFAQRKTTGRHPISASVAAMLEREAALGMKQPSFYSAFQAAAERVKNDLIRFLIELKSHKTTVAAYGAAAKGNTLLNFAGVRSDLLPYVVDRNPAKQGLFMPGSRIPIVPEEVLRKDRPAVILILPWNLAAELLDQLAYARAWDARFVVAVPSLSDL